MLVTVIGGTGFLGHRIARRLLDSGHSVRIVARHPERFRSRSSSDQRIKPLPCDIRDEAAVSDAIAGADGVVNAASLYVEKGGSTFRDVHLDGARRVARIAQQKGIGKLIHISGIGSDPESRSLYIRRRGEGEVAVRETHASPTVFRPSVMFASNNGFLATLASLLQKLPVMPLFGKGQTRLQPVSAEDVAQAAVHALNGANHEGDVYEFGGPEVWTYRNLLQSVMQATGQNRRLVPVPFAVWDTIAAGARILPNPPVTEGQVALMKTDNVASDDYPGLRALGVSPASVDPVLEELRVKSEEQAEFRQSVSG